MNTPEQVLENLAARAVSESICLRYDQEFVSAVADYFLAFEQAARAYRLTGAIALADYVRLRQPIIDAIAKHASKSVTIDNCTFSSSSHPIPELNPQPAVKHPVSGWREQDPML